MKQRPCVGNQQILSFVERGLSDRTVGGDVGFASGNRVTHEYRRVVRLRAALEYAEGPDALSYLAGLSSSLGFFFTQPVLFHKQFPGTCAELAQP